MRKPITDRQMAAYWASRVTELEALRPMTNPEALAIVAECEREIAELETDIAAARRAESTARYTGRVGREPGALAARDRDNARAIGAIRQSTYGVETRICQLRSRAEAYRRVAEESGSGATLRDALTEARQRAEYYASRAVA